MTQILPDIFAIEVPEDAKDFGCVHVFHGEDVVYYPDDKGETVPVANAPCHCDKVEILFTTKDLKEEDTVGVVDGHFDTELQEWRYGFKANNSMIYESAVDALQSLLRSHNLTGKNYLLIKKQQ